MSLKAEWKPLLAIASVFALFYFLPTEDSRIPAAMGEALALTTWYAREHVLLCLVPAFFIAGAIAVFVSQGSVMKYLGPGANKLVAYGVSSVSGSILAVCSCTVLPLFAGIYRMGAGLGPAAAFLYAGPAINVLAIILTARILGMEIGIARAVGAVVFSIVIGLMMNLMFRKDEIARNQAAMVLPEDSPGRPLWQTVMYFGVMVAVLVFANWGRPQEAAGFWHVMYGAKWWITGLCSILFGVMLTLWYGVRWWHMLLVGLATGLAILLFPAHHHLAFSIGVVGLAIAAGFAGGETAEWLSQSWGFAKQIMPLLFGGVLVAGLLLGRPGHEGLLPSDWIADSVGGNSLGANLFASVAGAFMYFATLTEIPILQGLLGNGMGKGPALALLLAGPALSLPNMLVIRSVMGTRKTVVFVLLVIAMATASGFLYGLIP
ncbi:MAG: permease [candidate division Zixibacteria bacterium]|nr:permease [candidate division Zixibacteria bacterium]